MSLDVTTLAMAKKYTDSQRLGFTEQNKIILGNDLGYKPLDRDVIGLKVTDERDGRRFLATELDRPNASVYADSEYLYIVGGDFGFDIQYSNFDGLLSKECLVVGDNGLHFQCPAFFHDTFTTNEGLLYVFDETSDTMGLGITLKRGWYKVNQTTFACEPIDLEKTPCFFFVSDGFKSEAAKAYLYEYSTPAKTSYTVKPENIYMHGNNSLICSTDVSGIDPNGEKSVQLAMCWCSFMFSDGFVHTAISYPEVENTNVVIEYETIHTIDPKFLPSGGVSEVIDLDTIVDDNGTSLTTTLLGLFANGGGSAVLEKNNGFDGVLWDRLLDVQKARVVTMTIPEGLVEALPIALSASDCAIAQKYYPASGWCSVGLGFSFIVLVNGSAKKISCFFGRSSNLNVSLSVSDM